MSQGYTGTEYGNGVTINGCTLRHISIAWTGPSPGESDPNLRRAEVVPEDAWRGGMLGKVLTNGPPEGLIFMPSRDTT